MSRKTIKILISLLLATMCVSSSVGTLATGLTDSEIVNYPKPDLNAWRSLGYQHTKEESDLLDNNRAEALSAFLNRHASSGKPDHTEITKGLRLKAIALDVEDSVAVVGKLWDERYENEANYYLVQYKGGSRGTPCMLEKVSERRLAPQTIDDAIYRLRHVPGRQWTKSLVYLFRDDEGSHFRTATHELFSVEKSRLELLWTWKDEYAAWTNFDQKRGFSISNIDFSGLVSDKSEIIVYTTEGIEHSGKKAEYKKTRFVWDNKKGFRQVDGN